MVPILGEFAVLQQGIESSGFQVRDIKREVGCSGDSLCDDFGCLGLVAEIGRGENQSGSLRFFQSKEDDLRTSQPGHLECRYAIRCDLSVDLTLTEIRFRAKERLDISGGEAGEGSGLRLVFVGNEERLT